MTTLVDRLVDGLLAREGGYVNDLRDVGGETNFGVTAAVARANGYAGPMRAMTRDQAKAIYRSLYWTKPGLHLLAPHSEAVAEELFDTGVNMGPKVAGEFLQRALNALNQGGKDYPDLTADGSVGPATAAALKAYLAKRGRGGERVLVAALNCLQGARYIELSEARAANEAFAYGWLANRVALPA